MSIQYNGGYNGYSPSSNYYPTAQPVQAQPVQAQPVQAQPVYTNGETTGNVYVAQPVEPGIQYGTTAPARVIYSGQQYSQQPYYAGNNAYGSASGQPFYGSAGYGNHNQMYRDMRSEEQRHYYAREQRRREELADEMCCLAGITAGCCLCLALD